MTCSSFAAGLLVLASGALATTVTVIQPSALPANDPTITFDGLPLSNGGGPTVTSYTEQGFTLTASPIYGYNYGAAGNKVASPGFAGNGALFSFNTPVSQVAFTEFFGTTTTVTLYGDAAGTQSLGTYSTPHDVVDLTPRPLAFASDTAFRSFSVTVSPQATYFVDDLRYTAVPEPSTLAAFGTATLLLVCSQRHRRTA